MEYGIPDEVLNFLERVVLFKINFLNTYISLVKVDSCKQQWKIRERSNIM